MEEFEEVLLIDEDGNEVVFEHILTFNYEGKKYGALVPKEQADDDESEIVFLQIEHDDEGDVYLPVENEVLLEELFDEFNDLMDELYEDDDE